MDYKCVFCGKDSHGQPLYHDWPFNHLKIEGMCCWACYHSEIIKQDIAAFSLSDIGNNGGWIQDYTLAGAIEEALEEAEDNMDRAIGIDADIGGSYTSSLIIRNGNLYLRVAELRLLMEAESSEEKRTLIEQVVNQLTWAVQRPMPKTESGA